MKFKIDMVSDVVCPWCFVGKRRLEKAIAALSDDEFEMDTFPFQLNPDLEEDRVELETYLANKFGGLERVRQMQEQLEGVAKEEDIKMNFSKIKYANNTLKAHALIQSIASKEQRMLMKEALLSAYFEQGKNIGSNDVLVSIAKEIGVSYDEEFMNPNKVEKIRKREDELKQMGINAVPTFIINDQYLVQGAQSAETFMQAFSELKQQSKS